MASQVPDRGARAVAIADHRTQAARGGGQLRTLPTETDPQTEPAAALRVQTNEMARYLLRASKQPPPGADRAARALLDLAPAVIHAAHAAAAQQLRQGRWLITYGPQPDLFAQRYPEAGRGLALPRPKGPEVEPPRLLAELREAGRLTGPDLDQTLKPPAALRETRQAFDVLHPLVHDDPGARPALVTDVDADHARSLNLGEEHRDRLRAIRERLRPTGDELREEPVQMRTRTVGQPAPPSL